MLHPSQTGEEAALKLKAGVDNPSGHGCFPSLEMAGKEREKPMNEKFIRIARPIDLNELYRVVFNKDIRLLRNCPEGRAFGGRKALTKLKLFLLYAAKEDTHRFLGETGNK